MSMLRTTRTATLPARSLYVRGLVTTSVRSKSLTDTVKETADTVNKKVGQALAGGIEKTEKVTQTVQETIAEKTPSESEVKSKAEEVKQKANQTMGQAAGKARDVTDDVKKSL